MKCSKTEFCFQIIFVSEQNEDFKINIEIVDIKKIFKKHNDKLLVLDFKLKPSAIRNIGDSIKNSGKNVLKFNFNSINILLILCV